MRSYLYFTYILGLLIAWSSCRKDFEYAASAGNLEFSRDTVFLDTLFADIGSGTYVLKVYNPTRDDVEIPSIALGRRANSDYRLNVDGIAGKEFNNIPLFAKDSLFIFIEITHSIANEDQKEFLYTDVIQFDSGGNMQEVQLVALVKDAIFLYPRTLPSGSKEKIPMRLDEQGNEIFVEGFPLSDETLNFTADKPYIIYGYAMVPEGKELVVDAGTRVHFHKDSGIVIAERASIKVNGSLSTDRKLKENEVIFAGDRLEPEFETIAGQWGSIYISKGSVHNELNHLTIKNAGIGLFVDGDGSLQSPTLTLKNTQIYNSAAINLWARSARVIGENCVFGSSGNASLYCSMGGNYIFSHTTIANFWQNGYRSGPALRMDNFGRSRSGDLVKADFVNCIIDGNTDREMMLGTNGTNDFNFFISHTLIKFNGRTGNPDQDPLYDFRNTDFYGQIYLNQDSNFVNSQKNDFRILEISAAASKGDPNMALSIPYDIQGMDRTFDPAVGAYQIFIDD